MEATASVKLLESATPAEIDQAYQFCSRIVSRTARNFSYAFRILPKLQRRAIEALYAFCRSGDDIADRTLEKKEALTRLQRLRQSLDLVFQGLYCDWLTLALADAQRRFRWQREHFEELLKGLESDIQFTGFTTHRDLVLYCYRVASVVGLLCLKIWGADTRRSRRYALLLGQAMQLTNILRDLSEDYQRGRIYIPTQTLEKFGLTENNLFSPDRRLHLQRLVLHIGERARRLYRLADRALPPELHRQLIAARIMGKIYRKLLEYVLQVKPYNGRIELSRGEKMEIVKEVLREIV